MIVMIIKLIIIIILIIIIFEYEYNKSYTLWFCALVVVVVFEKHFNHSIYFFVDFFAHKHIGHYTFFCSFFFLFVFSFSLCSYVANTILIIIDILFTALAQSSKYAHKYIYICERVASCLFSVCTILDIQILD